MIVFVAAVLGFGVLLLQGGQLLLRLPLQHLLLLLVEILRRHVGLRLLRFLELLLQLLFLVLELLRGLCHFIYYLIVVPHRTVLKKKVSWVLWQLYLNQV